MKKPAKKTTSSKRAPAKTQAAPAAKKSAPKAAPKAAARPPKPTAPQTDVGRYTPGDIPGTGWKPFRYPPE